MASPKTIIGLAMDKMTLEQQMAYVNAYRRRRLSMTFMIFLSFLFPIQLIIFGHTKLGVLFLVTAGGLGLWYVMEWFVTPFRVRAYNAQVAREVLLEMGIAGLIG